MVIFLYPLELHVGDHITLFIRRTGERLDAEVLRTPERKGHAIEIALTNASLEGFPFFYHDPGLKVQVNSRKEPNE